MHCMKLEIVLNEEKAKEHHYNIHKGYAKIEDFMIKQGFSKISEGVLEGDDSQKSFDSVLLINRELAKTKWFPLLVEKWWWHIDGEIEDCMGFEHRQGSGYVSKEPMRYATVDAIVEK